MSQHFKCNAAFPFVCNVKSITVSSWSLIIYLTLFVLLAVNIRNKSRNTRFGTGFYKTKKHCFLDLILCFHNQTWRTSLCMLWMFSCSPSCILLIQQFDNLSCSKIPIWDICYTLEPSPPYESCSSLTMDPFIISAWRPSLCVIQLLQALLKRHLARRNYLLFLLICQPKWVEGALFVRYHGNITLSSWWKPFWRAVYFLYSPHERQGPIMHSGRCNFSFASCIMIQRCILPPRSSSSFLS